MFAGGWLADRLGAADRGWYARLPAIAWLITAPAFAIGLLAPSLWLAWPLLLVANGAQHPVAGAGCRRPSSISSPQPMRATASASFLFINNLVGLGVGPLLIGRLSDALKSTYGVRFAALRGRRPAPHFYLVAALLIVVCGQASASLVGRRRSGSKYLNNKTF